MKIGSKLALYKLKLEYENEKGKIYKATAVENFQVKTPYGNAWEQHFINNIIIYTNLELEIANFDVELPPKTIETKDGRTFEIKQSPLSFDRISNPEKSIIRVIDFEYKINNLRNKKGQIVYKQDKKIPQEFANWIISNCEYDYAGWKLPEKVFENQIKYYKKQHEKWKENIKNLKSENRDLKNKNKTLDEKILKLKETNKMQKKEIANNKLKEEDNKSLFKEEKKNVFNSSKKSKEIIMPTFDEEELI